MAHQYFSEHLGPHEFEEGATVEVIGDEARHAVRVARMRVGERTTVGNGSGVLGEGPVTMVDRDRFAVRLDRVSVVPKSSPTLTLVQALAKGDRDERAVEQATEFGVQRVVPWQADRSVSRWDVQKAARGIEKWQRVAREAAKQALRPWVPRVDPPMTRDELAAFAAADGRHLVVLHPLATAALTEWAITARLNEASEIAVVVGPEGGLSEHELEGLTAAGAVVVRLGDAVLRTSSAGPAALAVLNVALGRW